MYIITYSKQKLTFKAETREGAERVLRRCEVARGQMTPEAPESAPKLMSAGEYLAAEHLTSFDGVTFDDPAYL